MGLKMYMQCNEEELSKYKISYQTIGASKLYASVLLSRRENITFKVMLGVPKRRESIDVLGRRERGNNQFWNWIWIVDKAILPSHGRLQRLADGYAVETQVHMWSRLVSKTAHTPSSLLASLSTLSWVCLGWAEPRPGLTPWGSGRGCLCCSVEDLLSGASHVFAAGHSGALAAWATTGAVCELQKALYLPLSSTPDSTLSLISLSRSFALTVSLSHTSHTQTLCCAVDSCRHWAVL